MIQLNQYFLQNHKSISSKFGDDLIISYVGFPLQFTEQLVFQNDLKELFDKSLYMVDGKINIELLEKNEKQIIAIFLTENRGNYMIPYEILILLDKRDLLQLCTKPIVLVKNNFFDYYPNPSSLDLVDLESILFSSDFENKQPDEIPESNDYYVTSTIKSDILCIQYASLNGSSDNIYNVNFFDTDFTNDVIINFDAQKVDRFTYISIPSLDDSKLLDFKFKLFFGSNIANIGLLVDKNYVENEHLEDNIKMLIKLSLLRGHSLPVLQKDNSLDSGIFRKDIIEILEKYRGSKQFRDLKFYVNPDLGTEKYNLSQGAIIEMIIQQVEIANDQGDFSDVFITAPTGAGKSVLFQIPAIYIGKNLKKVTIVVSPLIALMIDQVESLHNRGVKNVAYINSNISLIERERVIDSIHNGDIDILYLSPELLLSYDLKFFIGDRQLGLLVIDEAHLITTRGRDFRVDYWYLGTYIGKIRRYQKYFFPVATFTATAVYGGDDDSVFDTIESLEMQLPKRIIGSVRRDETMFKIYNWDSQGGNYDLKKSDFIVGIIKKFIDSGKKAIVYCPWTRQTEDLYSSIISLGGSYALKCGKYYGSLDKYEKTQTIDEFRIGKKLVILSTKAFGMGVDISDIEIIYHFAPSGYLADYVQEIGRVARSKDIKGYAMMHFNPKDLKYSKILHGLSATKQYQVRRSMEKIFNLYLLNGRKSNMLVSADDFAHIFDESNNLENKVKSVMMLLEKDLKKRFGYNLLIIRPKNLFTQVFICIAKEHQEKFLSIYREYVNLVRTQEDNKLNLTFNGTLEDLGNIYVLKLDKLRLDKFPDKSFPAIKKMFFDNELFGHGLDSYVAPRYYLKIQLFLEDPVKVLNIFNNFFHTIKIALKELKGFFYDYELIKKLEEKGLNKNSSIRIVDAIKSLFVTKVDGQVEYTEKRNAFLQEKKDQKGLGKVQYRFINKNLDWIESSFSRLFGDIFKNKNVFNYYIERNTRSMSLFRISYLIEAFELGSYEIIGGESPKIFIRINDPAKLKYLVKNKDKYTNNILVGIEKKYKRAVKIMEGFFTSEINNKERRDLIENYFLGGDEILSLEEKPKIEQIVITSEVSSINNNVLVDKNIIQGVIENRKVAIKEQMCENLMRVINKTDNKKIYDTLQNFYDDGGLSSLLIHMYNSGGTIFIGMGLDGENENLIFYNVQGEKSQNIKQFISNMANNITPNPYLQKGFTEPIVQEFNINGNIVYVIPVNPDGKTYKIQ